VAWPNKICIWSGIRNGLESDLEGVEKMNSMTPDEAIRMKKEYLMPSVPSYYQEPLFLKRGEMQYLYDVEGNRFLDFYGGIYVVISGHCNPFIYENVISQMNQLVHSSCFYLNEPSLRLAKRLAEITPGRLKKTIFVNSGSEAIEVAILLAKTYTGREEILALQGGYHGRSMLTRSLTGQMGWRHDRCPVPGIVFIPNAYCYRCPFNLSYPTCDLLCARYAERVITTSTTGKIAAVLVEPIQGVGGLIIPPPEYFAILKEIVKKYGGILIVDEVQTGFGRTGDKRFGIEHWEVEPDIIVVAKALGNGLPIGAVIATDEIASSYQGPSVYTFGGNPVICAAALANLEYIEKNKLPEKASLIGNRFKERLLALKNKYPGYIGDVRSKGLMVGVEIINEGNEPNPVGAREIIQLCKDRGLLIGLGGSHFQVLRMGPPLIISEDDIEMASQILDESFNALKKGVI